MKAIWFFYLGVVINGIALIISSFTMLTEQLNGSMGFNNPAMMAVTLAVAALIVISFVLKSAGRLQLGAVLLWLAAAPLLAYGLFVMAFMVFKPDMK